jgi:hypothetical protein
MNLTNILKQISSSFDASSIAYKNYIENGKTFQYAKVLREINDQTKTLLTDHLQILPLSLQPDALAIIAHYDAWMEKWDQLKQDINPSPGDVFIFANDHRFPKDSAKRIEEEYSRLSR